MDFKYKKTYLYLMQRQQILQQLSLLKTQLEKQYPIASMALFGSYSRNEQTPQSDIDICIDFNGDIGWEFLDIHFALEKALKHKVDLVSKNGIPPKYFNFIKDELIYV